MNGPADWTPRAQKVIELAKREAERANFPCVGTEHLLLGIVALGDGIAVNVLERLNINPDMVREEIARLCESGPDTKTVGNLPFTPRSKKVLHFAIAEARQMKSYVIDLAFLCRTSRCTSISSSKRIGDSKRQSTLTRGKLTNPLSVAVCTDVPSDRRNACSASST